MRRPVSEKPLDASYPISPPDAIRSTAQRSLYRWWERRRQEPNIPLTAALSDDAVIPILSECIYYQVLRRADGVDFQATSHGSDVHPLFGRRVVGTMLGDHAAPELLEGIIKSYRVCVSSRRPVFTLRHARDMRGAPAQIQILRLPLGENGSDVDAILSHFIVEGQDGPVERRLLVRSGSTEDYAVAAVIKGR